MSALTARSSTPCSGPSISSALGRTNVPRPTSPLSRPRRCASTYARVTVVSVTPELAREDALGRQPAAWLQPARFDLAADRVGDGLVNRAAPLSSRRQLDCHPCNMSLDCLQCQDRIHSISKSMETMSRLPSADIVRFGIFELSLRTGELRKRGLRHRAAGAAAPHPDGAAGAPGRGHLARGAVRAPLARRNVRRFRAQPQRRGAAPAHDARRRGRGAAVRRDGPQARLSVPRAQRAPAGSRQPRGAPATIAHIVRKRARLAVLPFGPYDGFTDGLTEEAMTQLTQTCPRTIGVIARTSVARAQRDGGGARRNRARAQRRLSGRRQGPARRRSPAHLRAAHRVAGRNAPVGDNVRPRHDRCAVTADRGGRRRLRRQ